MADHNPFVEEEEGEAPLDSPHSRRRLAYNPGNTPPRAEGLTGAGPSAEEMEPLTSPPVEQIIGDITRQDSSEDEFRDDFIPFEYIEKARQRFGPKVDASIIMRDAKRMYYKAYSEELSKKLERLKTRPKSPRERKCPKMRKYRLSDFQRFKTPESAYAPRKSTGTRRAFSFDNVDTSEKADEAFLEEPPVGVLEEPLAAVVEEQLVEEPQVGQVDEAGYLDQSQRPPTPPHPLLPRQSRRPAPPVPPRRRSTIQPPPSPTQIPPPSPPRSPTLPGRSATPPRSPALPPVSPHRISPVPQPPPRSPTLPGRSATPPRRSPTPPPVSPHRISPVPQPPPRSPTLPGRSATPPRRSPTPPPVSPHRISPVAQPPPRSPTHPAIYATPPRRSPTPPPVPPHRISPVPQPPPRVASLVPEKPLPPTKKPSKKVKVSSVFRCWRKK